MIDRLIDVILQFVNLFKFWVVVDAYEKGIVLRLGKFNRELGPGIHWLIPGGVDNAITDNVVTRVYHTRGFNVLSRDGVPVHASVLIRFNIRDIKKAVLEVENIDAVIQDSAFGHVSDMIRHSLWEELHSPTFGDDLTKQCRRQAFKYGVEIESVVFLDLTKAKALALVQPT